MQVNDSIDGDGDVAAGKRRRLREDRSTPRAQALRAEAAGLPKGDGECFAGYGIIGLPFAGGDLLAFRRFPASSIGPGYAAIWHRNRAREWTFYVSVEPALSCPRYFGNGIDRVVVTPIETTWIGHDHLVVSASAPRVEWSMRMASTAATRVVSAIASLLPERAWSNEPLLAVLGAAAGVGLRAGPMRLAGVAPNGQRFRIRPRRLWRIDASAARVEGRELGPIGQSGAHGGGTGNGAGGLDQAGCHLGDFRLPDVGLFACGDGEFDRLDPALHGSRVGRRVERP